MPISSVDDDVLDNDPTDELPVLSDALLEDRGRRTAGAFDDTGTFEDTGQMRALGQQEDREAALAALAEDLAAREAQVTQLEAEIEQLKRFDAEAGSSLTRHEALLATMRKQQGEHDAKAAQQRAEIERLAGEIDERERRIVALLQELDQERARVQALEDDARVLQQQLGALEAEQEIDRQQRSSRKGPAHGAELRRLRGEVASLSQHIENRNRIWREQKEALAVSRTRVRELELELDQRFRRQAIAENRADAESRDAQRSRQKLREALRQLEQLQRPSGRFRGPQTIPAAASDEAGVLTSELKDDPGAMDRLHHLESTILDLQSRMSAQLERDAARAGENRSRGTLVCLTGDHPEPYRLDEAVTMIGRGTDCDIRIMTHYVSRQHARILIAEEGAVIEDLGSRNGVFVNAVRVDRHVLEENDLVTVGDTQFRFESNHANQDLKA
ncbi:MAG TPA: FHA domain-containing protein [Gammaproteobacteria bacterium]|jgi:DNA repair exonuclease SbcCD ATPase subunit